jgi:hypothetical protein
MFATTAERLIAFFPTYRLLFHSEDHDRGAAIRHIRQLGDILTANLHRGLCQLRSRNEILDHSCR